MERLATSGIQARKKVKGRKNEIKPVVATGNDDSNATDAAELSDFVQYLADEIFVSLASDLRNLSYAQVQDNADLKAKYAVPLDTALLEALIKPLPLTVSDSLCSYGLTSDSSDVERFLEPVLTSYIEICTSPLPEHTPALTASRPPGCEICQREHLPLTYHHLIPRQVHEKAVKRCWHREWELNKVAWLCRACHSFVHKIATNEELAREWYDVDLLLEREDVRKWASWAGRVRWKAR